MIGPTDHNEQYLSAVFNATNDAIFVMNPDDGTVVDANARAVALLGCDSREQLVNRVIVEHRLENEPEIEDVLRQWIQKARTEGPRIFEWTARQLSGALIPTEVSLRVATFGERELAIAIVRDISDRKNAEKYLQVILDASTEALFVHDAVSGEILAVNRRAEELFGISRSRLAELDVALLSANTPPYTQAAADEWIRKTRTEGPQQFEWKSKTIDGRLFDTEIHMRAETLGNRELVIVTGRDISERKQKQRELQQSRERFELAMEASKDGLWDWNIVTGEAYYSPGYAAMLGYAPGEVPLRTEFWMEHLHPDDKEATLAAKWDCIANRSASFSVEFRMQTKDGNWRWILGRGKAVSRSEDGKATRLIGTHTDITEQKSLQAAIEKRIFALTQPDDQIDSVRFEELFDLQEIQRIQNDFSSATGVASIITRPDGSPITQPSNFTRLCYTLIRQTEKGCANCTKSDAVLGQLSRYGPTIQQCLSGGLWDAGASIEVGGKHIANWLIGQVRDEAQTDEAMRAYAREIGADEAEFMEAFHQVPVMSQAQFQKIANAVHTLAQQLSTMAFQNLQQARFIAERKKSTAALQESEKQYRMLFENMPSGFALDEIIFDAQGRAADFRFIQVNPAFEKLTGLQAAQVTGKRVSEVLPATEHSWIRRFGEVVRSGRPTSFEDYSRELEKYYSVRVYPAGPQRCAVIFDDTTERKKTALLLQESEERFRGLLENTPNLAVQGCAPSGAIHYWNKGAEVTFGYTAAEALGQKLTDLIIPPEMRPFVEEGLQRGAETGIMPPPAQHYLHRKDGSRVPVLTSFAINRAPGKQVEIFCMAVEISAQKKAENQLRQLNEIQNLILDNSTLGVALVSQRTFEWVNPRLGELFRIPCDQLQGTSTRIIYSSDEAFEQTGALLYNTLNNGSRADSDVEFQRRDGSVFWCRLIGKALDPADPDAGSIWMFEDITDRKEAELKIADLARFPQENTNPVLRISTDGILLYTNPAGAALCGTSNQDIGTPVSEKWASLVRDALADGQAREIELKMEASVFAVTLVPVKDRGYINIYARDITQRIVARKEMDESRRLLRSIIDTIPVRVFWKDRNAVYLGGNKAFADDAGIATTEDLSGKTDLDLCGTAERARAFEAEDLEVIRTGQPRLNVEKHLEHSDGSSHWIKSSKVPLRDTDGSITGLLGVYEEISQQKAYESELLRLSTAIEQSPESVIITDLEGCIQYVNPAFSATTGYARREALSNNPSFLSSGEHDAAFYATLWETIQGGETWEGRFTNRRKDGTPFIEEASISPVKDADGSITNYVAVKRDITEELKREEEFRQSQKMEAVGQLAGGIAHDFNNILQGVLGFSEILMRRLEEGSLEHLNVQEIHKSATRAAALISQLLAFSRKQPAEQVLLNLNTTILDDEVLLSMLLGERFVIDLRLSDNLPMIHADHNQMTQVIMNLAVNARDAMPNGGRLTIKTDIVIPDNLHSENKTGAFVCMSVSDTGCGMTEDVKERLFDPFFTTKNVGEGTGLGLSVVYGIVQQNRGWIQVESALNEGTTFKICLPVAPDPAGAHNGSATGSDADRMTILLVEDDRQVLEMVTQVLETADYCIRGFENAEEALSVYEKNPNAFTMLLTDICLPDQNGFELANTIRLIKPSLPVLIYTGDSSQKQQLKILQQKNYHFIEKPLTVTALLAAVNKALARAF